MSRLFLALVLVLALPAPPAAQGGATARPAPAAEPAQPTVAMEPQGFDYDPDGRRDPFVSLLRRGGDVRGGTGGVRPAGLAGLETAEVTLKGTLESRGGYIGILQGADTKTYIVRPGDRLFDGVIRSIAPNAVIILQQVDDPLSLDKQREVRKTIRQADEAK